MLQQKTPLFVDVLIMSEVINTMARLEFNVRFKSTYGANGFKQFRNSPDFTTVARNITAQCRKIVNYSSCIDHLFSKWDIRQLLTDFAGGGEDFNDQLIVQTCKEHALLLLTDDGDMTRGGLRVITANPKLLRACPS